MSPTNALMQNDSPETTIFRARFAALTGNPPFLWQKRLYEELLQGKFEKFSHCDIPTGLGKTSVLALWLLALAEQASHPDTPLTLPRRLVYVVNRRVVVDQATDDARSLLKKLHEAKEEPLLSVANALRSLAVLPADKPDELRQPFALSTLRGQFADNRAWSADPCRPAIIVGTVDLIGSRLLFSAYRAGYKTRPLYAAFLGQDALIVHDEAHLEPAFQDLLTDLSKEQFRSPDERPIRVMALSATNRQPEIKGFSLEPEEETEPFVARRLNAKKILELHALGEVKLPDRLTKLALRHASSGKAVLIFARSVEDVKKIADLLVKEVGKEQVRTLTGTMRGKERDGLVKEPMFRRFLPEPKDGWPEPTQPGTVCLVCTSAGEVGVNLSADHLVCDLTSFESMAQRFGRVNRFGDQQDTKVDVVYSEAKPSSELPALLAGTFDVSDWQDDKLTKLLQEAALARTFILLEQLKGDASPGALRQLNAQERADAFSAAPPTARTSPILLDAWALTSIREPMPSRPKVAPFLHGLVDPEPPATSVAWREEVGVIVGEWLAEFAPKGLLEDYPLKPHELLREPTYRVWKHLEKLAEIKPDDRVWVVDDEDEIRFFSLRDLVARKDREKSLLNGCTVLLSPTTGGLSDTGNLDGSAPSADDVSGWSNPEAKRRRFRSWKSEAVAEARSEKMRLIRELDLSTVSDENPTTDEAETAPEKIWRWFEARASADGEGSRHDDKDVPLAEHTAQVEKYARDFAFKLALPPETVEAVRLAGAAHDLGKRRVPWQRSIGNFQRDLWLAKSGGRRAVRDLSFTYRHELGSLLDAPADPAFSAAFDVLTPEMQELTLHLIASHHGRARPHFAANEVFDPSYAKAKSLALAAETPHRFARLQRRYGRWGLAFLESLLRAADYAASANPQP